MSLQLPDDVIQSMDPEVVEMLKGYQVDTARSLKNPSAPTDQDFCPPQFRDKMLQNEGNISAAAPDHFEYQGEEEVLSDDVDEDSIVEETNSERADRTLQEKKSDVVEITMFAADLNKLHEIPSELDMMAMRAKDVHHLWLIWDERFRRKQSISFMRNVLAVAGLLLGFSGNQVYKFFVHDDIMDMRVWTDHWWAHVTTQRPGRQMPFDLSLLMLLKRLSWLKDIACGEGSMIMGLFVHMYKERERQLQDKRQQTNLKATLKEELRSEIFAEFANKLRESNYAPQMQETESRDEDDDVSETEVQIPSVEDTLSPLESDSVSAVSSINEDTVSSKPLSPVPTRQKKKTLPKNLVSLDDDDE